MPGRTRTLFERMGVQVAPDASGCLLVNTEKADEQPRVYWQGQPVRAARAVWEETHGPVPQGMMVAHSCHRLLCVALEHLYLSSPEEAMQDLVQRGAFAGEAHWNHKLTNERIHWLRSSSMDSEVLADMWGVAAKTITRARTGRSWRHL
jgi:hypothetical protein